MAPLPACPACGEASPVRWRTVSSSEPALAATTFSLWRCPRCGSALTAGEPAPGLHDAGAFRPGTPRLHRAATPALAAFDRQRLALLRRVAPPPGRLLDAGAGRGRFVLAARAAGYDAFGIEPSARGVLAAEQSRAPVQRATIAQARVVPGSLSAVTLWHVLEHLDEPGAALDRISSWLAPGGALLLGVPNLASLQARLGGARWFHLDVPRHRVHYTPAGLHSLLRAHGFTVIRTHHLLLEHNPFGMWQSLISRATREPSYLYNLLKRNVPVRPRDLAITTAAMALTPLAAALELIAGLVRRGGTIAVLARRTG